MKRMLCAILGILFLSAGEAAAEEAPGFGFINMRDTALQEEPGGETMYSLPRDTCVWIRDSVTDTEGNEWLAVNTGLWKQPGEDLTGWVSAEQVDSGEEVWHDVVSVSADECGMIALKADGTAETAGRIYPPMDPLYGPTARRWTYRCGTIMQVQAWVGGYAARMEDGSVTNTAVGIPYYPSGKEFRLLAEHSCQFGISAKNELTDMCEPATRLTWYWPENAPSRKTISRVVSLDCQHGWLAMLTDSGELLAAKCWESSGEEPVWSRWRDLETFHMKDNSRKRPCGLERPRRRPARDRVRAGAEKGRDGRLGRAARHAGAGRVRMEECDRHRGRARLLRRDHGKRRAGVCRGGQHQPETVSRHTKTASGETPEAVLRTEKVI